MARPAPIPAVALLFLLPLLAASPAYAVTARDLGERMAVDGSTVEFTSDEIVFGFNVERNAPIERTDDSQWGPNNDFGQIRITWDARYLYIAGEGVISGNNMLVWIDAVPGRGLSTMSALNSWRRKFNFAGGFAPDLFAATWDGNASPRLLIHQGGNQVLDAQASSGLFQGAASFQGSQRGRSMEFAIPWSTVFLATEGLGTTPVVVDGDTLPRFAPGTKLLIAGAITAGGDGTGGPDSAPDNTRGHVADSGQDVFIDNYAIVEIDANDDTGLGGGGPDGIADWGIEPLSRVGYKYRPPFLVIRSQAVEVELDRPAFAPDRNEELTFRYRVETPVVDDSDPTLIVIRVVDALQASVYDINGRFVRLLYSPAERDASVEYDPALDRWDGRDSRGQVVRPGTYVLLVVRAGESRLTRPFVVVR